MFCNNKCSKSIIIWRLSHNDAFGGYNHVISNEPITLPTKTNALLVMSYRVDGFHTSDHIISTNFEVNKVISKSRIDTYWTGTQENATYHYPFIYIAEITIPANTETSIAVSYANIESYTIFYNKS